MASTNNIWNLLVASGLVKSSAVAEIRTHCEGELGQAKAHDSEAILGWLHEQKRISGFQKQVLAEGQPGPFRFEQYQIFKLHSSGPFEGSYRARHIGTNHPVHISFFGGTTPQHAVEWAKIRRRVAPLNQIASPFVSRCYEFVEDGDFRFVVFEDRPGKSLSEKLPFKGRLPWPQTLQAVELLAIGLSEIHDAGQYHGRIWPGAVWLQRGGICQLLWRIPHLHYDPNQSADLAQIPLAFQSPSARDPDQQLDIQQAQRNDLFSLGALAFRMVSGKNPKINSADPEIRSAEIDKHMAYCEKHKLPDNVAQILRLLLAADVNTDLKDAAVAGKLIETILESQSIKADAEPDVPTLKEFQNSIGQKSRSRGFLDTLENIGAGPITQVPTSHELAANARPNFANLTTTESPAEPVVSARERLGKRKSKKANRAALILGGSILSGAILIGVLLSGMFPSEQNQVSSQENDETVEQLTGEPAESGTESDIESPPVESEIKKVVYRPQDVIEDDQLLWESPTGALPIDVGLMPASPDFLLALRPRLLAENPEGVRFVQSFGPRFAELAVQLKSAIGFSESEIERVNVSLHGNDNGQYDYVVLIELTSPISQNDLWQRVNKPTIEDLPESELRTFQLGANLIYFEPNTEETIATFGFGPAEFLRQSFDSLGPAVAGRSIGRLLNRSDRDRHATLIFRNAALLSQEGMWLFDGNLANLRRPLNLFLDDRMEAVKLSLHFEQDASYLEWMSDQNQELDDEELLELLPGKFSSLRDQLTSYISQIPPHSYWATVQQRFDNMLNELVKQIRVGRERDGIVANCWLPSVAPHNLLTAGELVLNGTSFAKGPQTTATGPATLEELLATPRSLTVTNDPDLINLMKLIEQEISDDMPDLPFEFRIRLLGSDLAVDGITQNQRPGRVEVKDVPLGEILAQIMLQANPDKSATSPADEKCNLIWLIGPDPDDPGTRAVLVTTRNAARARNLTLPKLFQPE